MRFSPFSTHLWARWLPALLLLVGLLAAGPAQAQTGLVSDELELQALRALYAATGGTGWTNRTGWEALASATTLPANGTCYGVSVYAGDVTAVQLCKTTGSPAPCLKHWASCGN